MADRTVQFSPEMQGLKKATRELVIACGGQEEAARYSRRVRRHQSFSDYAAPNVDLFMPVDVVADLEAVTRDKADWPHVTRYLAQRLNMALVALPDAAPGEAGWHQAQAALTKEFADVSAGLSASLAAGPITAEQVRRRDLIRETRELAEIVARICAMLERTEAEE